MYHCVTVMDENLERAILALDGLPSEFVINSAVSHGLVSLNAISTFENTGHSASYSDYQHWS